MQSENFDKKIRDSLSQRPPGNDNPAWDKMEVLLDKHMPQEKRDRRRIFLILFLFLLTGGGAFLIWQNGNGDKTNISAIESQDEKPEATKDNSPATNNTGTVTTNDEKENVAEKTPSDLTGQTAPSSQQQKTRGNISSSSQIPSIPGFIIGDG